MARIKIFPKTFLYTLSVLIFIVITAHGIMYVLAPQISLGLVGEKGIELDGFFVSTDVDASQFVTFTIKRALPVSVSCCIVIAIVCAALFSRSITRNICHLSETAQRMTKMDKSAICSVTSGDEIEDLAENINSLYRNLLKAIHNLELEKKYVQESEKLKIDFLRAASHELKTPITIIKGQLQGMLYQVGRYKDRETYLAQSLEVTDNLEKMVQELLAISRLDTPGYICKKCRLNLSQLISDRLTAYEDLFMQKDLTVEHSICPETFILGDIQLLQKVLDNLLGNAAAYSEARNQIIVRLWKENEKTDLTIENTGAHIPDEAISKLFEPFYRVDQSRNRQTGGTGLGLYIVKTILDLHGAKIEIANTIQGVIVDLQF